MSVRAARTLGLTIIGIVAGIMGLEAVGRTQEADGSAVPRQPLSLAPAKVLKEQIPTLPMKIVRERIPTMPTKIGREPINSMPAITLPAKAGLKSANTVPPAKGTQQEAIPTLPAKGKKIEDKKNEEKKTEGFQDPVGGKAVDKK
jgi:hypothetical protein